MADRKCGLWLGILVLGSLLPAVLVKFGAGNFSIKIFATHRGASCMNMVSACMHIYYVH